ncbi:MAG: hypothetical protein AAFQ58_18775 [Pseudomonadota bacterium]
MRPIIACFAAALSACAPQYVERVVTDEQDLPVRRAIYQTEVDSVDKAFIKLCDAPGDEVRRFDGDIVQCRSSPTPDFAAFLLLQFDAALEPPTLVVRKKVRKQDEAFEVEMSYFAEITQKSGEPQRIYLRLPEIDAILDGFLRITGGVTPT